MPGSSLNGDVPVGQKHLGGAGGGGDARMVRTGDPNLPTMPVSPSIA